MTSIRLGPKKEMTPEEIERWKAKARSFLRLYGAGAGQNINTNLADGFKLGLKWNCEHNLRPGECNDPECVAEFIHDE